MAKAAVKPAPKVTAKPAHVPPTSRGRPAAKAPVQAAPKPAVKPAKGKPALTVVPNGDRPERTGIGARTKDLIKAGKENAEIVAILGREFPQNTGNQAANVNWYRNQLRKKGEI